MQTPITLKSRVDASTNFVFEGDYPGLIEARYVRRRADYLIVYISSQTGCRLGCRMCHLTQTGQTASRDVTLPEMVKQAETVLEHYDRQNYPAEIVHFNFMARGEVFANKYVIAAGDDLIDKLATLALSRNLLPVYKFSTIMPRKPFENISFTDIFRRNQPDIYYSLYSTQPSFRRQWLPGAIKPHKALDMLARWQQITHKIPVLHWPYIEGQNDDAATLADICTAINSAKLRVDINIVRYNPFSATEGQEPDLTIIERNADLLRKSLPGAKVQLVDRVGVDVQASCGMFVA